MLITLNMNKKQIKQITNNYYSELKKLSKKIAEIFDADAIHRFRVVYKKLRAFLRMISYFNKTGGEIKISKKLKNAYHISGTIRDLQLQQQRIQDATKQEFKRPQAYLDLLQQTIDKLKPELAAILQDNPVDKCKKNTAERIPGEFTTQHFNDYTNQKWAVVNTIIASRYLQDNKIHAVRKNLKDLFYNFKMFNELEPGRVWQDEMKGKEEHYFVQLLEELGVFQDKYTAIVLLSGDWLQGLNAYNRKLLIQIKKACLKDREQLKAALLKKLQSGIVTGN